MQGSEFRVRGTGFGVHSEGFRVEDAGSWVRGEGLVFRISWFWFKFKGSVDGSGLRVEGSVMPGWFRA